MSTLFSDTDSESFSESGSEDREEINSLYGGQAQSILSSLEDSIGKIDNFLSFERGFVHGDIVWSVTDSSGQMGRVEKVDMFVDLENVFGRVIKDVNSKKLLKIRAISVGDYVACGPWLGRVGKVIDRITVLFDDGAMCEIMAMDPEKLLPISANIVEDSQYLYYPGQRVQVRLSTMSKSSRWLCDTWKENQDEGTVCGVEAGLVSVDWLASAPHARVSSLPTPPRLQDSKNLTLLSCLSHANWQLGDWCILPNTEKKGETDHDMCHTSTFEFGKALEKSENGLKRREANSNLEEIYVIVKTKTKVDILWQNGTYTLGLDSQTLCPINIVDVHEFWPGQYVTEKGICDNPDASSIQKWGVVKGVDAKEKTVRVKWEYLPVNLANHLEGTQMEEIVSAYELVEHPNYSFGFGDGVFRTVSKLLVNQNANKNHEEDVAKQYLSHIGHVTGFSDGFVQVTWASGLITKVAPYEIVHIDKYEGSVSTSVLSEENIEDLNEETFQHDNQSSSHKGKNLFNYDGAGEDCKMHSWKSSAFSLPQAAMEFFTSIAGSLFGYTSMPGPISSGESELCNLSTETQPLIVDDDLQISNESFLKQQDDDIGKNDMLFLPNGNGSEQLRKFDMVSDCSDHHFIDNAAKGLTTSQIKREWLKAVQQEWSILEKDLPESIYVRVYEERMDLLRAAIVGAPGTPYHDGLFFFDIFLPPEYPHQPPLVYYQSGGLRINPNLYESGKVCLSLLNTWTGKGTEVWNPCSSTILQVLISLQALVLNEKPYFNEAGYDSQMGKAEGEKNSISYNENAFLLTCKSMLYVLKNPPKHFEQLVEEHFSRRSCNILMACKAYLEGASLECQIGFGNSDQENQSGSSMGFKIMLTKLYPKLVEGFTSKGIDCSPN